MTRTISKSPAFVLAIAFLSLACVATTVAPARAADLDLVFVIDTTSSMGGEIREAKQTVRTIAGALRETRKGDTVRMGVVAFRDRGDDYVTRIGPLDTDTEASLGFLSSLSPEGGGDGPEDVIAGIAVALRKLEWRRSPGVERLMFLIGDAPPHLDYDGPRLEELIEEARRLGIVINAIGCRSLSEDGVAFFRALAYATEGRYQHIGAVRAEEPVDLGEAVLQAVVPAVSTDEIGGEAIHGRFEGSYTALSGSGVIVHLLTALPADVAHAAEAPSSHIRPSSVPSAREMVPREDHVHPAPRGGACFLEISLSDGINLEGDPLLTQRGGRLDVDMDISAPSPEPSSGTTSGVSSVFALDPCVPVGTSVRVSLGGRS